MNELTKGVLRFQREKFPLMKDRFARLAGGQSPRALFITCSDSRVDPSLITQSAPGELFVHENPGNFIPPHGDGPCSEGASLEYALEVLGVNQVVICGHSQCGAVAGLLDPSTVKGLSSVSDWLRAGKSHVAPAPITPHSHLAAVEANVVKQLEHARTYPFVARALAEQRVSLYGWVYHIATGEVSCHDPAQGCFVPLGQDHPPESAL